MKYFTAHKSFFKIVFLFIVLTFSEVNAQTPGLIYEPATGAGAAILDPNGDGFVSMSASGFTTDDQLQSEIPYSSLVFPMVEPNSDLGPGPNCGFTDFVDQGDQDPVQSYLDASNNWLYRMRMGNTAPNSKSYSILIDTDGKFGGTGPNADPNYSSSNPGFEIEIVLSTKFGVFVYDVNNMNCTPVISYAGTTNYQKSIAFSTSCGNPDYFYDFYVKFSDLTAQFGITPATKMRMAIVDNMAANKSTLCNASSASDLAGIDDASCGSILENCFGDIIDNYTPCAPGVICPDRSVCPSVNGSINAGATAVSGTSSEADGTIIKVYINGVAYGTTTSVMSGVWTLSGITPVLAALDVIGASATAPSEGESEFNCSLKTVGATCSANPTSASHLGKSIQGIAPVVGATINVYQGTSTTASVPTSGSVWNAGGFITVGTLPSLLAPTTDNFLWKCVGSGASTSFNAAGPACLVNGAYRITATEPGKCESPGIWICVGGGTPTRNPTFTTTPILTSTTSITGSVTTPDNVAGVAIYLYANGTQIGTTTTGALGAWTIGSLSLTSRECETLSLVAIRTATSLCPSTGSVITTVKRVALAPTVNGPICTNAAVTSVSGTSVEATGTIIQVFENGIAEGSTTTVLANGTWTASTGISIALGSTITAKASSSTCLSLSAASNAVVVGTKSSNAVAITTTPIFECAASVSGTGTNGDVISLFIDGFQIGGTTTVSGGVWTIGSLDTACFLYTDGIVTAKATTGASCEGNPSAGVTVVCVNPLNNLVVTPASTVICSGSNVAVTVQSSETGIIYQLFNGAIATGTSKLGTGSNIILTSAGISSATTLTVKAIRLGNTCTVTLVNSVGVTIDVPPTTPVTTVTQPTCTLATGTITVTVQTVGETYSFDNGTSFQMSNSKSGLAAGNYDVIIKSAAGCNSAATITTVDSQPSSPTTPATTVTHPTCALATGTITVTVQNATDTYSFDNGTSFQTSNSKSGLAAATIYDIIIKNTAGCNSVATATTVNSQPATPPQPPVVNCWDNFVFNTGTCTWNNTGAQAPQPPVVNCWDNFVFNTGTCTWNNTGAQDPQPPVVNCWDNFVFNTGTCTWNNTGAQDPQPPVVNCWDNFVFNTGTCTWNNTGAQDPQPPVVNCWDNFVFNTGTCTWNNTGSQAPQPPVVNCWDNFVFNTGTCTWNNTGAQAPQPPVVNCWDNFVFNTGTCTWNNTGAQDPQPPVVNCWDNFVFNTGTCTWNNTGAQDPQPPVVNCWDNFVFNTGTCTWNNTGAQDPQPPVVNCWDNFVFNTGTCTWNNTGAQDPQPPVVNCWDNFVFNTGTCTWNNTGSQDPQPPVVNCWDNFVFNTGTCTWNNTGAQDPQPPVVNCWDNFVFNTGTCTWNNTGSQAPQPPVVNCWDNFVFNTGTCTWNNTGSQDPQPPVVNCWDNFVFNTGTCTWNNTGAQDPQPPVVNCWDNFVFNTGTCTWNNTGAQDPQPAIVNCWDNFVFNTGTCVWDNTGTQAPQPPVVNCWDNFVFNTGTCTWNNTGAQAPQPPVVNCWDNFVFNTGTCTWNNTGAQDPQPPVVNCWDNFVFNTGTCTWNNTGSQDPQPPVVNCWDNFVFNTGTCTWNNTGAQDPQPPVVNCWDNFVFNTGTCTWNNTGAQDPQPPVVNCWDNFVFNTGTCTWNNTGAQDPQPPVVNCWDNFVFNTGTCTWNNTGAQDPQPPVVNCWDNFVFNTGTCTWNNTGAQDPQPPVVNCWDNFVFNTGTCTWNNTGAQDPQPPVVNCWDNFVFNTGTCTWNNTGAQDPQPPVVNCWDNFVFNTGTCTWNNTGSQDPQPPVVNCWDNFVFNTGTCTWNNTGAQDPQPAIVNCWDNFVFNTGTCTWNNTGAQDPQPPVVNCWDNFVFNTGTCTWNNTGAQDPQPPVVNCWDNFVFNTGTCTWNNTGAQDPQPPVVNCWDNFVFNTGTCTWNNTGAQDPQPPVVNCWDNFVFNTGTCTWNNTGAQDPQPPVVNCWDNFVFNTGTCTWNNTGSQDPQPPVVNCWDNFVFNTGTCTWNNTGAQDPQPAIVNCWDNFVFNTGTCTWNNTGAQDPQPAIVNCWDNFVFNTGTCVWDNTGTQAPQPPVVNCWDNFVFNTGTCTWNNTGAQDPQPAIVNCWDNFVFNTGTCVWDNTGTQAPQPPVVNCWDNFVFNTGTCTWNNTGAQAPIPTGLDCWQTAAFNTTTCVWDVTGTQPAAPITTVIQPTCVLVTGIITVTVQVVGETYSFDNGVTFQTGNSISGLVAGNYNMIIKNSSGCNSATALTVINAIPNCTPLASNDTPSDLAEDSGLTNISVLGNDSFGGDGPNGGSITVMAINPAIGTAILNDGGTPNDPTDDTIDFTPTLNFSGAVSITYIITDANGDTSSAIVTFNVNPVNDAPIVDNDTNITTEGNPTVGGDLTDVGDTDPDGTPLLVTTTPVSGPTNGTIIINADGTYVYTPNPDFSGTDVITIEICDSGTPLPKLCVNQTLTITVNPVNDVPIVDNDTNITTEDNPTVGGDLTDVGDTDPDGTPLLVTTTPVSGPTNGTIVINADGTYVYTPNPDFSGTDVITIEICDSGTPLPKICVNQTLTITVNPVNDPPIVDNDTNITTEGNPTVGGDLTDVGDTDPDGTPLLVTTTPVSGPTNGTIIINADGTYVYTPNPDFSGTDVITIEICDSGTPLPKLCVNQTLTITVNPVNDPPIVDNDTNITTEDNSTVGGDLTDVGDTDPDGTPLLVTTTPVSGPTNGIIIINADGTYVYTPNPDFSGTDVITIEVCDSGTPLPKLCVNQTLTITVSPVNDPPIAISIINPSIPSTAGPTAINSLAGTDVDGTVASYTILTLPLNGILYVGGVPVTIGQVLTPAQVATLTYDPSGLFVGNDAFSFRVTDNLGAINLTPATVTIPVAGIPKIAVVKTAVFNDDNGDGFAQAGETITFNFIVKNTGDIPLTNITISDPLPGVVLQGGPIALLPGATDSTSFTATYQITQTDIILGTVTNQALVRGTTPLGAIVQDYSDGDDENGNDATVLGLIGCVIEVFNAISPNNDSDNEFFYIRGLECYSDNTVEIYNRWGVLVFEREQYNNADRAFKGVSEGRSTINQKEELPDGTYFYILKYKDSEAKIHQKAGYLYINR